MKAVRILVTLAVVLVLVVAAVAIYILAAWDKPFDAPSPAIAASHDPEIIARGKHLAFGAAHCALCHVPMDRMLEVEGGKEIPLSGGWELAIPPGVFRAPNITPDMATGIGKLTDAELARILRYSVGADGRYLMPFMPFQDLSDDDLVAIISFLRSQEPVRREIPRSEYTFMGKALLALGALTPPGPTGTPPRTISPDSTVQYGRYLAYSVANCMGCHTERDEKSGEFIGPAFAGGYVFGPNPLTGGYTFVSTNLTPDLETGVMAGWDEAMFVGRFRLGRTHRTTPMPWGAFSRMSDLELQALYRYLHALEPVRRAVGRSVFAPGEQAPGTQ